MKRLVAWLLGLAGAMLVAFCVLPVPVGKPSPKESLDLGTMRSSGPLRAGAARVRIQLPEHPVLAGYGGHRRAREATEPVYARAIAIQSGPARVRMIIAAVDTLLIPPSREFWGGGGCGLIAATHTHTGPGGLWDDAIAGWIGAGKPDALQRAAVGRALSEAMDQATAALELAELQIAREVWTAGPARARSEGPIDPDLVALRFRRPGGSTIATLVVYAMHPTSAPRDVLSADWPGQLESDAPVLVLQGAGGNTTWRRDAPLGPPIATEVEALLRNAPAVSEAPLECATKAVNPRAQASLRVPWLLRRAFSNVLAFWGPLPLARQNRVRIGSLELLGVPGEPVGELGLAARPTVLVGLADGYLGYVETPERWQEGKGESAKTYFGPELAHTLGLWPR